MSEGSQASPLATPAIRADLEACIHCGLCLPACPTYDLLGAEPDGPRGRIALLGAAALGELPPDAEALRTHLDRCLGCRACESACPSGVPYGRLLEAGRAAQVAAEPTGAPGGRLRRALLGLLARRRPLRALAWSSGVAQRTGLLRLLGRLSLPGPLANALRLAPPAALRVPRPPDGGVLPANGSHRGAVALFRGCVQDAALGAVNHATAELLRARGYDVYLVSEQTCCGALARHAGEPALAARLTERNRAAFGTPEVADLPIVCNAGGCAATLAEDEGPEGIGPRVVDLSAFLLRAEVEDREPPPADLTRPRPRVAYLDSCHLRHGLGLGEAPRALIAARPECEAVDLPHPDRCCGSAGTYNLRQRELSDAVLALRLEDLRAARPEILVVANPGCHLQMLAAVREAGLPIEVLHLAQWLARLEGLEGLS